MKRTRFALAAGLVLALLAASWPAEATNLRFAHAAFQSVWARTDQLVADHAVARSWLWGPSPGLVWHEPYKDAPGGTRLVQYFDKSRMEINNPGGNPNDPFFVTNGLLVVELISGRVQTGDNAYEQRAPADVAVSGDFGDSTAPTYAGLQGVANTPLGDHKAPNRTGAKATATINRAGQVGNDASKATVPRVDFVHFEPTTGHNIPRVFWDFLNQSGPVLHDGKQATERLFTPWFYASGYPIAEPYWAQVHIAGKLTAVLIQAFERRVLTYTPTNPPAFQVEMGNVGAHYRNWRYAADPAFLLLSDSLNAMDGAPSYHASSTMDLVVSGLAPVRFATQEADYAAPNKVAIHQIAVGATGPQASDIITIGATGYVSATDTNHVWTRINPGDVGADPSALNIAALPAILQSGANLQIVGDEPINGVATRHVRMTLDPAAVPKVQGLDWSDAAADAWIAPDTHYLARAVVALTLGPSAVRQGQVLVRVDFRAFGQPVTIAPPLR